MKFDVFLQLQNGELTKAEGESDQAFMERIFREAFSEEPDAMSNRIFNILCPRFAGCDAGAKSLSVAFTAADWMLNPQDTLHGGILSTALDMTMSTLGRCVKCVRGIATVQLSINFIRPIPAGAEFVVTAAADHVGRRSVAIRAEVHDAASGKLVATASGVFM